MSNRDQNIDDMKKELAKHAKEEAKKRRAARQENEVHHIEEKEKALSNEGEVDMVEAKRRAAEEAKAKAAALAKQKEKEKATEPEDVEKEKAIAVAKAKAAAAVKAKAAALAKQKEKEKAAELEDVEKEKAIAVAKAKAAAAAKAKAAALAKQKEKEKAAEPEDVEKEKAIAVAKAKAAAAAKAKAAALAKQKEKEKAAEPEDVEKEKAVAAAKAKAAAAKARAAGGKKEEEAKVDKPSQNQPYLDVYVQAVTVKLGEGVLEDCYINRLSKDVPTLVVKLAHYYEVMELLKKDPECAFNYMSELHATDFGAHMEVYVHLFSYGKKQSVAVKVKLDRDEPRVPSIASLWSGADWPEREAYDLLGVMFEGHPNLKRILMPDDWIGHPLRKDYEPFDAGV
ncbi:NADH-quinone oxidoreductase subunit C [Bacillus sp. FJAT-51639]|uniref:NADH-quinone oxidoreductase n=1 Tax=Bacillus bruguierae TaxID=3127667 RepID=A0ABU8FEJ8_9BACI